jgi:ABC-type multidrug transport system ATPase subunit
VTQQADEVERHADRVVAMRDGAVVFAGSGADDRAVSLAG